MTDQYFYPTPTISPFEDIVPYIGLLLGAVELELDREDVWEPGEYPTARSYIEDLKAYIQELNSVANELGVGVILDFAGATAPDKWLVCNGAAVSRTTYPDLFSMIGTTFGAGNGTTTFNLPDARGRVSVGAGQGAGLANRVLGQTFGTQQHLLTEGEMPSHNHTSDPHTHVQAPHTHQQNAHTHVQNAHNHSQNEHSHTQVSHTHGAEHSHSILPHSHGVFRYTGAGGNASFASGSGSGSVVTATTQETSLVTQAALAEVTYATPQINSATAVNQSATAVNQSATAVNQSATAVNGNSVALINATGGGNAHNNMQPSIALNKIIKALP